MTRMLDWVSRRATALDGRAALSIVAALIVVSLMAVLFVWGREFLNLNDDVQIRQLLAQAAGSGWAFPAVAAIYIVMALVGFPQFLLIAATVFAFGAAQGMVYAWLATLASATFCFGLGHFFGASLVRRVGGTRLNTFSRFLGDHGILASAIIRVVPSAPAIVINMTAGASHISFLKFAVGTAIGVLPKIAVIALFGASLFQFFQSRDPKDLAVMAIVVPLWIGALLGVRHVYARMRDQRDQ